MRCSMRCCSGTMPCLAAMMGRGLLRLGMFGVTVPPRGTRLLVCC